MGMGWDGMETLLVQSVMGCVCVCSGRGRVVYYGGDKEPRTRGVSEALLAKGW